MENLEKEFGTVYAKRYNIFKSFVENEPKSESAKQKISKIENGILKRNYERLPEIEKNKKKNARKSNGCAICGLTLASLFGVMCMFGENLSDKVFTGLSSAFIVGESCFVAAGLKYHIKLHIEPSLKKVETGIKKIKSEFLEFGESEQYLKAFMAINNLDEQKLNDENFSQLLESPLSKWGKLIEIYPELENE